MAAPQDACMHATENGDNDFDRCGERALGVHTTTEAQFNALFGMMVNSTRASSSSLRGLGGHTSLASGKNRSSRNNPTTHAPLPMAHGYPPPPPPPLHRPRHSHATTTTTAMINPDQGGTRSGSYNSKSGLPSPRLRLSPAAAPTKNPERYILGISSVTAAPELMAPPSPSSSSSSSSCCSPVYSFTTSPRPPSSVGPPLNNGAEDPNARYRDNSSWLRLAQATLTTIPANSGCMHWVGQIERCYKDGVSDQPVFVNQQEYPARNPKRQRQSHTFLSAPSINSSEGLLYYNNSNKQEAISSAAAHHNHRHLHYESVSSCNSTPSFSLQLPPSTPSTTQTASTNIIHSTTAAVNPAISAVATARTYRQHIATTASSLSIGQRRLLRRRQSRDISLVRRTLANELQSSKGMEECPRPHRLRSEPTLSASDLDEIIRSSSDPPQNGGLSHLVATATSDVPRYCSSGAETHHHHHHHQYMGDNLSTESLHAQYSFDSGLGSRTHSMSSLHSTPIHEASEDSGDQQKYTVRRTSDASETVFVEHQSRHPSFPHAATMEEYNHRTAWAAQQAFTPEHNIAEESPVDAVSAAAAVAAAHWWGAPSASAEEHKVRVEEWAQQESVHVTLASQYPAPHTPATSFDRGASAEPYLGNQATMLYARHPPSPAEDYAIAIQLKSSPSVPSPPESPGFQFGFGLQQSWPSYPQYQQHHRRSSVPLTPPSRPPSTTDKNTTVLAAATAALAASKPQRVKMQSTRPASRRRSSNSSMRSSPKQQQQHHQGPDASGEMSFVNFTPNDASRILSGVAPSGSSKTKARREREAMEKRRKLSEAAAAAVLAVGGDASALAKVALM